MSGRGVVMSVSQKRVIVMLPGGAFRRVHWRGPAVGVGQEIEVPSYTVRRRGWIAAPIAAALAALYLVGVQPPATAAAVVSVDINPSVNLDVSSGGRVLSAAALDPAGRLLLRQRPVNGLAVVQAVRELVFQAGRDGYMAKSPTVVIGAVFQKSSQNWFASLPIAAEAVLRQGHIHASVVTISGISPAIVFRMTKHPMVSVGRYLLWRRHSAPVRDRLTAHQVRTMPVSRLLSHLRQSKLTQPSHAPAFKAPKKIVRSRVLPNLPVSVPTIVSHIPVVPSVANTEHGQGKRGQGHDYGHSGPGNGYGHSKQGHGQAKRANDHFHSGISPSVSVSVPLSSNLVDSPSQSVLTPSSSDSRSSNHGHHGHHGQSETPPS